MWSSPGTPQCQPKSGQFLRRGEALALRWRDVGLDAGRLAVRRSVGVVKNKGAGEQLIEGPTKTGQSRVVDLDAGTVAALRAYRAARGLLALDLVRDAALVLSDLHGTHRHPERFSRRFAGQVARPEGPGETSWRRSGSSPTASRWRSFRSVWFTPAPPSRSPSTSTSTPGMGRQAADRFGPLLDG